MAHGHHGAVLEWLSRLPAEELDSRPRLLLAAAWSLATSERHEEAAAWSLASWRDPGSTTPCAANVR